MYIRSSTQAQTIYEDTKQPNHDASTSLDEDYSWVLGIQPHGTAAQVDRPDVLSALFLCIVEIPAVGKLKEALLPFVCPAEREREDKQDCEKEWRCRNQQKRRRMMTSPCSACTQFVKESIAQWRLPLALFLIFCLKEKERNHTTTKNKDTSKPQTGVGATAENVGFADALPNGLAPGPLRAC